MTKRKLPGVRAAEAAIIREEIRHFRRTWNVRAGSEAEAGKVSEILRLPGGGWALGWRAVARLLAAMAKGRRKR